MDQKKDKEVAEDLELMSLQLESLQNTNSDIEARLKQLDVMYCELFGKDKDKEEALYPSGTNWFGGGTSLDMM